MAEDMPEDLIEFEVTYIATVRVEATTMENAEAAAIAGIGPEATQITITKVEPVE
jgi:hypothetical protein